MTTPEPRAGFGPAWSASLARAPEATLREWLAFALEACDATDPIALAHFRRDIVLERKPDRSFVTVADQGIERELRTRIRRATRTTASWARNTASKPGTPSPGGSSTRSTPPTTSSAACPCSGR